MIKFQWDARKASLNQKKHGIGFEEAQSVFFDDYAVQFFDEDHSDAEDRFLLLGMSNRSRILLVCHCELDDTGDIRIISARRATQGEKRFYGGPLQ